MHSIKDVRRLRGGAGGGGGGESEIAFIHMGRIIKNRLDARWSCLDISTTIRQKIKFPAWSCCLQPASKASTDCSKARAKAIFTEKVNNPPDELANMSQKPKESTAVALIPKPDLDTLLDGI